VPNIPSPYATWEYSRIRPRDGHGTGPGHLLPERVDADARQARAGVAPDVAGARCNDRRSRFARGARTGVLMIRMPAAASTASNAPVNTGSSSSTPRTCARSCPSMSPISTGIGHIGRWIKPVRSVRSPTPSTRTSRSSDATGSAASSTNSPRSHEVTQFRAPTSCTTRSSGLSCAAGRRAPSGSQTDSHNHYGAVFTLSGEGCI
jgi:hypothetical protein